MSVYDHSEWSDSRGGTDIKIGGIFTMFSFRIMVNRPFQKVSCRKTSGDNLRMFFIIILT